MAAAAYSVLESQDHPRWALTVAILSIGMVVVLTPFAQSQALRFIHNLLLGLGPLAIGLVLWRLEPTA